MIENNRKNKHGGTNEDYCPTNTVLSCPTTGPSLENRICFGFNSGDDNFMGLGYGRGGLGKDIFTFALLDWRGSARQQMCVWSDPENRN